MMFSLFKQDLSFQRIELEIMINLQKVDVELLYKDEVFFEKLVFKKGIK